MMIVMIMMIVEFVPVVVDTSVSLDSWSDDMRQQIKAMEAEQEEGTGWFVVEFHTKKSSAAVHLMGRNNVRYARYGGASKRMNSHASRRT